MQRLDELVDEVTLRVEQVRTRFETVSQRNADDLRAIGDELRDLRPLLERIKLAADRDDV